MASPDSPASSVATTVDPEIQMNPYNINEDTFSDAVPGRATFHAEFSDHGGELGVYLFFSVTGPVITI